MFVSNLFIFLYAVIIHEVAHGLVAERLGDPTAKLQKRLTLNPLPHIDPFMSLILPLFLILTGSPVIFGAAKPVPIDPYNLRHPKKDLGLIGLAGPAANFLTAILASAVAWLSWQFFPSTLLTYLLQSIVRINIILGIFNLTPIPPMDGGRVLTAILPEKYANALTSIERFGMLILIFLLLFPTPLFSLPAIVFRASNFVFNLIFPSFPIT